MWRTTYGWLRGHLLTVAGGAAFLPTLWRWLSNALGWFGDADLLISKYNDPGWVSVMFHALIEPPAWFDVPLIVIGFALIYWDIVRHRRVAVNTALANQTAPVSKPEPTKAVPSQASGSLQFVPTSDGHFIAAVPPGYPLPPPVSRVPHEPEWSKLFRVTDEKEIALRFLPDTADKETDALLLVVFGYEHLLNTAPLRANAAHWEAARALREAPNADVARRLHPSMDLMRDLSGYDMGAKAIKNGDLERVRLSEGGFYQLTNEGRARARHTAMDLIRRA